MTEDETLEKKVALRRILQNFRPLPLLPKHRTDPTESQVRRLFGLGTAEDPTINCWRVESTRDHLSELDKYRKLRANLANALAQLADIHPMLRDQLEGQIMQNLADRAWDDERSPPLSDRTPTQLLTTITSALPNDEEVDYFNHPALKERRKRTPEQKRVLAVTDVARDVWDTRTGLARRVARSQDKKTPPDFWDTLSGKEDAPIYDYLAEVFYVFRIDANEREACKTLAEALS